MKVRNMKYVMGDHLSTCDRCGFTYLGSEMKKEWTGLIVCGPCWDPRHPQDLVRAKPDKQSVKDPRPAPTPVYTTVCTMEGRSSLPTYAVAGCSVSGLLPEL